MGKVINLPDPLTPRVAELKADIANLRVAVQIQNDAMRKAGDALAACAEAMAALSARVETLEQDYLLVTAKLNGGWTPL